jgi:hypothetical protein
MPGPQPIRTAPLDGTEIMLWLVQQRRWVIGRRYNNRLFGPVWEYDDGCSTPIEGASHWRPLPEPPPPEETARHEAEVIGVTG